MGHNYGSPGIATAEPRATLLKPGCLEAVLRGQRSACGEKPTHSIQRKASQQRKLSTVNSNRKDGFTPTAAFADGRRTPQRQEESAVDSPLELREGTQSCGCLDCDPHETHTELQIHITCKIVHVYCFQ